MSDLLPPIPLDLPDWFLPAVAALFPNHALVEDLRVVPMTGGGNNRVFLVRAGTVTLVTKWYFSAPEDPRDRWRTEWEFATFAWQRGLRGLPEPVACDPRNRLSLFEFIPGRRLDLPEVGALHVAEAIQFLIELNQHRGHPAAQSLPTASEACFSFAAHCECILGRVRCLQAIASGNRLAAAAQDLILGSLVPVAERVVAEFRWRLAEENWSETTDVALEDRILSPSDFGFHNALLDSSGRLRFLDFEYAGWDDPAKTVCDFFSQVAVPAPRKEWRQFATELTALGGAEVPRRAELLRPLFLVKWSCIVLNPLSGAGRDRQQFSRGGTPDAAVAEAEHLARAARLLSEIEE